MRTVLTVAFLLLVLFAVAPVVIVFGDSFVAPEGGFSLQHYRAAFAPAYRLGILFNSIKIATLSTLMALVLGLPYAFFCTRVRTPFRNLFSALYILPLVLPPLLMAMGWSQYLLSLREGKTGLGPSESLGGITGISFILALAYFPFIVLFARKAFLEIGAGLEEAARVSKGPLRSFFSVTFRLAMPSIMAGALFVFLFSIADFSVTDYVSIVASTEGTVRAYPFEAFQIYGTNFDAKLGRREGAALGLPLAVISIGLLLAIMWLIRKGRYATVVSGHRHPGDVEAMSPPGVRYGMRGFGFLFLLGTLVLAVGIPVRQIVNMARDVDHPETDLVGNLKQALLGTEWAIGNVGNSLLLSAVAALVMVILSVMLAHWMIRRGPKHESFVMLLAFLPMAFGPIMYGAGLIRMWNQPWMEVNGVNPVYDGALIVIFMLVGKYLPFALAAVASSIRRIDPGYEEAGAVAGVGWGKRMTGIVAPLATHGLIGAFILGFVFSMRELDTMAMLSGGNQTAMLKIYRWMHIAHDANVAGLSLTLIVLIGLPFLVYVLLAARRIRVL